MQILYPEIKPFDQQWLKVDSLHELYLEQSGSPHGIPVVVLHGGPGGGCDPVHRRYFDPNKYRIILFDQRGAGQSRPHAELTNNTTQDLIDDLEAIRCHLDIEQWMLFGGSWGSTLALVYAQAHQKRVSALLLRGIFLGRQKDLDWLYQEGASEIYPDYWEDFIEPIPENERHDMVGAYYKLLTGDDEIARMAAAKSWSLWEGRIATLQGSHRVIEHFSSPHLALSLARIETHYFQHKTFLKPNQILDNAHLLKGVLGIIVHGRYDMVCPLDNAWSLLKAWPRADLQIIRDAGHSASEPGIIDALVRATRTMAIRLSQP
ncbi:MAG: prolyl aminopeptidase [Gammaproteobacteria bacterium CG22_combo_CG10-13_8_21_14_all_40_8]|nr:MAG: prolyl aminopeptidase [Gammaproteobacteria bacterium CG22_combo_CG10-13_8_21_14_all_40_8]